MLKRPEDMLKVPEHGPGDMLGSLIFTDLYSLTIRAMAR
jgi:hypothetical protein